MHDSTFLNLNFLITQLSSTSFSGTVLSYQGRENLQELRQRHRATHVFHRDGNQVYCVPISSSAANLGQPANFETKWHVPLVRRLIHEALIRFFIEHDQVFTRAKPIRLVNTNVNLIEKCSTDSAQKLASTVKVHPEYEFEARVIYPSRHPPVYGITVSVSTASRFIETASQLLDQNLDIIGRYVFERKPPDNPVLAPELHYRPVGRVQVIKGNRLVLTDHVGRAEVDARECYLEPRLDNVIWCLQSLTPFEFDTTFFELKKQIFELTGAEGRRRVMEQLRKHLAVYEPIAVTPELTMTLSNLVKIRPGVDPGRFRRLSRPDFVFDPAGNKTKGWHNTGLQEYGPFDAEFFTKKTPQIVVITPSDYKGEVEVFLRKFKDGIAKSKSFAKGFVRKYHLHNCQFEFAPFELTSPPATAYKEACLQVLSDSHHYDLAFVVLREDFSSLPATTDPYLITKSVLMAQGVPVQELEIETILSSEKALPFILDNLGLASYAKLGGIPWTIVSAPGMTNELVIGMGSAELHESRFSEKQRFVGITTVFQADGKFLLANSTREVSYEDYPGAMLEALQTGLSYVAKRNAWQPGEPVRLIFHVFKPLKNTEAQVVKRFVERLTDYDVEFAFLHLSSSHPWLLFDPFSPGVKEQHNPDEGANQLVKGKQVPEPGNYVALGRYEALLTMTGPRSLKTPLQGCPSPLLVKLHRESTFTSLDYLTHQVFKFSFLSWRSFQSGALPVTITYSDRIAELLGKLRQVPNWNPDILRTQLRSSRWFL